MANNFAAFFETLVAGADEYNKAKVGRTALLDAVYKDVKPEAARIGKTVDVYFPDVGPLQAINNGILTGTSVNPNYIPLVFQTRAGAALQFQDFEQWQTAVDLAQKFFDPLYKRAREYLNGQIAALITTANFNSNAPIIGATQGEVQVGDQLNAWGMLADQKVPLEDRDKLRLMVHNQVYRKMLGDSAWVQESLVSAAIAFEARQQADVGHAFNFQVIWDQQMPTSSGSIIYGQVGHDQLGDGHRPQHGVHSAAHGRHELPGLRQRSDQDAVQGHARSPAIRRLTLGASTNRVIGNDDGLARSPTSPVTATIATTGAVTARDRTSPGDGRPVDPVRGDPNAPPPIRHPTYQITATAAPRRPDHLHDQPGLRPGRHRTGGIVTMQQFTSLALHEYAIALALRPIATPDEARNVVDVTYIDLMGIPLRVMVSYVHIYQALFVTVDFGYALGVIRPDFGVIIQS